MNFEESLERVYKPYKQWSEKFRSNIQSRYRLLIDEIQSEKHQIEKIGELTNKLQNQYTKYHWKFPHEQIKEQLTEEELKKYGYSCTVELNNKILEMTKEYKYYFESFKLIEAIAENIFSYYALLIMNNKARYFKVNLPNQKDQETIKEICFVHFLKLNNIK